jgi:hypothetical protein
MSADTERRLFADAVEAQRKAAPIVPWAKRTENWKRNSEAFLTTYVVTRSLITLWRGR